MLQAGAAGMLNKVAGHKVIRRSDLRPALPAARVPQNAVVARTPTVAKVTGVAKLLQSGKNMSERLTCFTVFRHLSPGSRHASRTADELQREVAEGVVEETGCGLQQPSGY